MGYDATSGERNTTGQPRQTQALSFAGSTAKPHKASIMEELTYMSRMSAHAPYTLNWEIAISTFKQNRLPVDGRFQDRSPLTRTRQGGLELTDVAYPGWRFLLITCAALPGTRRVGPEVGPKSRCCGLFAPKLRAPSDRSG